jgi:hypothetical protein
MPVREHFELRVRERLTPEVAEAFAGLRVVGEANGTHLDGLLDQAELYGVLDRIRALGLSLMELRHLGDDGSGVP